MKKVMIVDDEIGIRENIRNSVQWEKEGFHYCGDAPDGELALPLIEEWAPDILITDIKMPFMNGLELASIIRAQKPHIKIIIMSGHDEFSYAQEAIRLGVTEYCLKPVSATELLQILHEVSQKMDEEEQRLTSLTMTKEKLLADLCGGSSVHRMPSILPKSSHYLFLPNSTPLSLWISDPMMILKIRSYY